MSWTPESLRRLQMNPACVIDVDPALCLGTEKLLSRKQWIRANARMMEEMGTEQWLREFLDVLEGGFIRGSDDPAFGSVASVPKQAAPAWAEESGVDPQRAWLLERCRSVIGRVAEVSLGVGAEVEVVWDSAEWPPGTLEFAVTIQRPPEERSRSRRAGKVPVPRR